MHPLVVVDRFRSGSGRLRAWGVTLLVLAGLLWVYAAWQMFAPYTGEFGRVDCSGPAFQDHEDLYREDPYRGSASRNWGVYNAESCAAARDWAGPLTALVLSTPLATVGGMLAATGTASLRVSEHIERRGRAEEN
ncbi:hypothetical protein AB0J21_10380 [Streptomyces sp. NPDC049954]|uniref:hypothetical protein n=1 Tax=Streptomyces sp. NPDC049954 TaxID=3155779 RepID=UPI003444997F